MLFRARDLSVVGEPIIASIALSLDPNSSFNFIFPEINIEVFNEYEHLGREMKFSSIYGKKTCPWCFQGCNSY